LAENQSSDNAPRQDSETKPTSAEDLGRPAEADAEQNKTPAQGRPVTDEKTRAREEFNLHEADLGRNPQG
jgi:hypothetical protein